MLLDVDVARDETKILDHPDILLQRVEVRSQIRIAEIILLGERPAETLRRLLGDASGDFGDFLVVVRIGEPARDAQRVLHEIRPSPPGSCR